MVRPPYPPDSSWGLQIDEYDSVVSFVSISGFSVFLLRVLSHVGLPSVESGSCFHSKGGAFSVSCQHPIEHASTLRRSRPGAYLAEDLTRMGGKGGGKTCVKQRTTAASIGAINYQDLEVSMRK